MRANKTQNALHNKLHNVEEAILMNKNKHRETEIWN